MTHSPEPWSKGEEHESMSKRLDDGMEQVDCDHDWQVVDDSFDHEFGTEKVVYDRCSLCDEEREHEPESFEDDVL